MESVNIQNVADVAETHIENRLNVQQKERFVTTVEKEITSLHAAEENVKRCFFFFYIKHVEDFFSGWTHTVDQHTRLNFDCFLR